MNAHNSTVARPFRAFLLGECIPGAVPRADIRSPPWGSAEFSVCIQVYRESRDFPKKDMSLDPELR